ncbi:site-specific integrase [Diplocloster agilis]|uniref:Site-specific integrase n=1 Tax=Diplocloster agilis TaxID=2850323 RepID=A0A949K7J1_9FIRM|nr:site-specific integrase [Diplocloster agilis]MBU9739476.1 site-specific integrase [Diplocloster agilis]
MSVTKDKNTGKWMSQVRIKDWTGKEIRKKKRGFSTKKEALQWERDLLKKSSGSVGMTFGDFIEIYQNDVCSRLKLTTQANKRFLIESKITPYFSKLPLNAIKPTDVRKWQNELMEFKDEKGKGYSETYLKTINNQLTAIFNYAVKFYHLPENPCHVAGSMGKKNAEPKEFWTPEEFGKFIVALKETPESYTMFILLYFTGIREGEMLALTPADIDFNRSTVRIKKNYQRVEGKDYTTSPKTHKGNRTVVMPEVIKNCMAEYMEKVYDLRPSDRLFPYNKTRLYRDMKKACEKSGVKKIRVHDIRHSHASLLIDMGSSPLLVAERLGHARVSTTMEVYSHLFPNKQAEVAKQLDEVAI